MELQRYDLVLAGLLVIALVIMIPPVTAAMVTINTSPPMGDAYYLGDTVTFSGINTESGTTYLFITGPNLASGGAQIQSDDPRHSPVREDTVSTFLAVSVGPDNQWSWTRDTHNYALDAGNYVVYAASAPRILDHISETVHNTTRFNLRKPVPTLTIQPSHPRQGDTITLSGAGLGHPGPGIAIWVIGPEYSERFVAAPDADGIYSLDLDSAAAGMEEGYYHVVVQHPYSNNLFDVYPEGDWVYSRYTQSNQFRFRGPGSLQGEAAYEALIEAFRNANIDDMIPETEDYDEPFPVSFHLQPAVQSAPVVSFTGSPTTGDMPLEVTFTDGSTGGQNGWAWFFGDEDYAEPWTLVTGSAGWPARSGHSSVVMPDGSVLLMGGSLRNDTWRSADDGATWVLMNDSSGWTKRNFQSSVVLPDGSIILMGGVELDRGDLPHNDTWRSRDYGATWTLVNESSGWAARYHQSSVALPDGSILVMGGAEGIDLYLNDVWRSTDTGATWTLVNGNAGWSGRIGHRCTVMPDGSIILMGGYNNDLNYLHDVWRSIDNGASWTLVNDNPGWSERAYQGAVAMPDGSIILMGGYDKSNTRLNDVWRSVDNGASWTLVSGSAGWSEREGMTGVGMPDGSILVAGGFDSTGISKNDVWRFQPAGSPEQDPVHTYATPGTYPVALQVYNSEGYSSMLKNGYITVGALDTAFNVNTVAVDPPGDMRSGVPVTVTCTVHLSGTGEETFRENSYLVMSTDLDNARWNYTMILDGVETPQPGFGGQAFYLDGRIISYPSTVDEALRVTLEGTAPPVSSPARQMIVNVTEFDSRSHPILSTRFSRDGLVSPAGTLPVIPLPGGSQSPTDPDHDDLYEDLNGDGLITFADIQVYFSQLDWMRVNEPGAAFDFNGNGDLEFDDIVHLNHKM